MAINELHRNTSSHMDAYACSECGTVRPFGLSTHLLPQADLEKIDRNPILWCGKQGKETRHTFFGHQTFRVHATVSMSVVDCNRIKAISFTPALASAAAV